MTDSACGVYGSITLTDAPYPEQATDEAGADIFASPRYQPLLALVTS